MLEALQLWATPAQTFTPWTKSSTPSTVTLPTPRLQQRHEPSFTSTPTPAPAPAPQHQKGPTLTLPRLLCLHGGGTNARIFRSQCRALRARLGPYFRLVFADAPFFTTPGPDVVKVYEKWGPFRSWFPPGYGVGATGSPRDGPVPICESASASRTVIASIESSIKAAMAEDDQAGASGPWVGVLGFSQGAKMAASLLLRQQQQQQSDRRSLSDSSVDYRFAVLLAGRAPMVSLRMEDEDEDEDDLRLPLPLPTFGFIPETIRLPTIHVHGMKDPGLPLHRELLEYGCDEGSARLIEWDGEHRVPIRSKDVLAVVDAILAIARETGVVTRY
ncbi:serine hydrolase-domain-containing protein [Aspergillus lucknowensis]|uniref:Serine hydrolase-domain-containing protein n=1 Tax=Aspergillus lucknowensis TaxID=176173 RepID=A0ABR4LHU1_9EURO